MVNNNISSANEANSSIFYVGHPKDLIEASPTNVYHHNAPNSKFLHFSDFTSNLKILGFPARAGARKFPILEKKIILNVKMNPRPTRYFHNILWAPSDRLEVSSQKFVKLPLRYRGVSELIFEFFYIFTLSSARWKQHFCWKKRKIWDLEMKLWETQQWDNMFWVHSNG